MTPLQHVVPALHWGRSRCQRSLRCWLSGRASAERRARARRSGARCGTRASRCCTSSCSTNNHQGRAKGDSIIVRILEIRPRRWTWPSCCRQANGDAQDASQIERLRLVPLKNPIQGLTARVLEYEDRPPFVTSERQRPGCPSGIEFGCERVFVLEPPETLR